MSETSEAVQECVDESDAPIIAHADDIDKRFAERAYEGISFVPDRRGESFRKQYADHINGLYADIWPIAKTEEQRRILADEMARYGHGYLIRCNALLAAKSRVVSAMIAGPSNFPTRQMEKRNQSEHNRCTEMLEWGEKARAAIKRKVLDARPEEVKASAERNQLCKEISQSLTAIKAIDDGEKGWTRSAFVDSIAGKVERLAKNREVDLVDAALAFVRNYNDHEQAKKPAIGPRHKFWTFGDVARESAAKAAAASQSESQVVAVADGVEAISNPSADRVQIIFDGKPDAAMISVLRSGGWNWSPRNSAWQRKLTQNAVHAAKQIVGTFSGLEEL